MSVVSYKRVVKMDLGGGFSSFMSSNPQGTPCCASLVCTQPYTHLANPLQVNKSKNSIKKHTNRASIGKSNVTLYQVMMGIWL